MNKVCFSPDEYSATNELSHLAQLIYLRALRPYMDYATGLIGVHRGISYQSIAEALYVAPKRGRHKALTGSPTKKAIRNAIEELVAGGVVANRSTDKKLILQALHAYTDQSARSMSGTSGAHPENAMRGTHKPSSGAGSEPRSGTSGAHPENAMRGTPPNSDINNNAPRAREHRGGAVEMTGDWEPSQQAIDAARMQGVPAEVCNALVGEFRLYWMEQGEQRPGWDSTFVRHAVHEWRKGALTPGHGSQGGVSSSNRGTTHDAKHSRRDGQEYRSSAGRKADAASRGLYARYGLNPDAGRAADGQAGAGDGQAESQDGGDVWPSVERVYGH